MIHRESSRLIDAQFEIFRTMLRQTETFMLRRDYAGMGVGSHEEFVKGTFGNMLKALGLMHKTVQAFYEEAPK